MYTSLPSRKIRARKPSHFGSKIQSPFVGSSLTRFASIGKTGGFTGSCMPFILCPENPRSKARDERTHVALKKPTHGSEWIINFNLFPSLHHIMNPTNASWGIVHLSLKRGRNGTIHQLTLMVFFRRSDCCVGRNSKVSTHHRSFFCKKRVRGSDGGALVCYQRSLRTLSPLRLP